MKLTCDHTDAVLTICIDCHHTHQGVKYDLGDGLAPHTFGFCQCGCTYPYTKKVG